MSRMAFDMIERAQRRPGHGWGPVRFLAWTLLVAALVFWAALILMV